VDLTKLTHLAMIDCDDAFALLPGFSKALRSLLSFTDEQIRDIHQPNTHEAFLTGLFRLRALRLSMHRYNEHGIQIRWKTIGLCWKTLRILFVDDNMSLDPFECDTRNFARFAEMCSNCSNLEQLAIQAPQKPSMYQFPFDGMKRLPRLRALWLFVHVDGINASPTPVEAEIPLWNDYVVQFQAQRLAQAIFCGLRDACPKLRAIGIEFSPIRNGEVRSKHQVASLRAWYTDPFNNTRPIPHPVPWARVKHYEACSEIFNNMGNHARTSLLDAPDDDHDDDN
jgi:hypothetical protein